MFLLRNLLILFALGFAQAADERAAVDRLLNGIVRQENQLIESLRKSNALIETYIQEIPDSTKAADPVVRDHYFLGRLEFGKGLNYTAISDRDEAPGGWKRLLAKTRQTAFYPSGFAQMVLPDAESFNRETYRFDYVRREFLGDVRCLVFDVAPIENKARGKFLGRIWVEDRGLQIVRFNGTYT